ncbi:Cysteine protease [Phytophthora megakarya]|uniref:Cysteine protease n=1 Tax=Phytophthora megakarya TaxID=4795 RepID=A0A225WXD6_9STRA|nr:Cysteine protease [Phytophthora megakarya]
MLENAEKIRLAFEFLVLVYMLKDINAMNRWHVVLKQVTDTEETLKWVVNTCNKQIPFPTELLDGVNDDKKIKRLKLGGNRTTCCGGIKYAPLLRWRENLWVDDACICHGLDLLRRENTNIGVVDPVMCHLHDKESKHHHISQGGAFNTSNVLVVLAMHVDGNHWRGIVFDFRVESKSITIFEPL